jgi:hypothetical protein
MTNSIRPAWLAIAGVVASTGVARADGECPPPTLDQCYEEPSIPWSYYQTACGAAEAAAMLVDPDSACNQIIAAVIASEHVSFPTAVVGKAAVPISLRPSGTLGDPGRDYIADAMIVPYDPMSRPVAVEGIATLFAGSQQRYASALVGAYLEDNANTAIAGRVAWNANGNSVGTCEEYVYERYYDYSQYKDLATAHGSDYRASFDEGIALLGNGVQSRSGATTTPVPIPDYLQPKNVFFTYAQDYPEQSAPGGYQVMPYEFSDPDLVDRLDRGKEAYLHTLDWHAEMSSVLADDYSDAELYALVQKQREFMQLLAKRAAVYQRWRNYASARTAAKAHCLLQFEMPQNPQEFKRPRKWEIIYSPEDRFDVIPGWDLLESYDARAFDGIVVALPEQLLGIAPQANVGVYRSPALDYGVAALDAQAALTSSPNDLLAISTMAELAAATPAELAGVQPMTEFAGPPVPGGDYSEGCPGYTAEDGLPNLGIDNFSCSSLPYLNACESGAKRQVTERLREIDAEIEQALVDVEPYGCIDFPDTEGFGGEGGVFSLAPWAIASPCDWNPEMFVREMENHFEDDRERDYGACMEATGGAFTAANSYIRQAQAKHVANVDRAQEAHVPLQEDYTGTTELVDGYVKMARMWAAEIDVPRDPVTHRPRTGHSASDWGSLGGGMFGVKYGFGAEWSLDALPANPWTDTATCGVGLHAQANASARAIVFGTEFELFDAFAGVTNKAEGLLERRADLSVRFSVLGHDILTEEGTASEESKDTQVSPVPLTFHVQEEWKRSEELVSWTFVIAGVPVTVRAGAAGEVKFTANPKVALTGACPNLKTNVTGQILPEASLGAFVSGGANVAIAEVGLQIDLTLIHLELPFKLELALAPYSPNNVDDQYATGEPMILATPRLTLKLSTLAGRFSAYVRFPALDPIKVTMFEWKGIDLVSKTVFDPSWRYSVAQLALAVAQAGGQ